MQDTSENQISGYLLPALLAVSITAIMAAVLHLMGRFWWCQHGDAAVYVHEAWGSSHTSQHLFDPYTFTHILHGVLFFWLTGFLFAKLAIEWRFLIAIIAETGWEVLENSNFIIEKYRENTASLDYFGDSIANSIGDVIACAAGFWIAFKFGMWRSLIFFIGIEIFLLLWIRDSLLLNILMLIYPLDGIRSWQMGM
ncbi:MAG TPA: DUF2585 family protein [Pyrinomonadaceae bacterium]|nr:DUF2585 family protein [Pyrinomonadaceae bacterium]